MDTAPCFVPTSGTVTTLASFAGFDGAYPSGSLVQERMQFLWHTESGGGQRLWHDI